MSLARFIVLSCRAALALSLLSQAAAAQAQSPNAALGSESLDAEARSLFEAGRTAFSAGRFEDARDHFQRAYDLSERPELLYNVAQAEDRLQNEEAALEAFEAYLAAVPDAENRAEVEARIEVLRRATERPEGANHPPADPASADGPTLVWTWVAGIGAVVTGGLAVTFWVVANGEYDSLAEGCLALGGGCTREEVSASSVEEWLVATNVMFVTSLVAAAALAIALPLELSADSGDDDASVTLRVGPGHVALEGVF